jgi:hypothetical protein
MTVAYEVASDDVGYRRVIVNHDDAAWRIGDP